MRILAGWRRRGECRKYPDSGAITKEVSGSKPLKAHNVNVELDVKRNNQVYNCMNSALYCPDVSHIRQQFTQDESLITPDHACFGVRETTRLSQEISESEGKKWNKHNTKLQYFHRLSCRFCSLTHKMMWRCSMRLQPHASAVMTDKPRHHDREWLTSKPKAKYDERTI